MVWSGESAGGIASLAHLDWAQGHLGKKARLYGAPVGGFYFSNNAPYTGRDAIVYVSWTYANLQKYVALWDAFLPSACKAAHRSDPWSCVFADQSYATVTTPLFVIEAQTDAIVMPLHDGLPPLWHDGSTCANNITTCPPQMLEYMALWKGNMSSAISQVGALKPRDSLFHPACLVHTGFTQWGPKVTGLNFVEALGEWLSSLEEGLVKVPRFVDSCSGVMCGSCNGTRLQ